MYYRVSEKSIVLTFIYDVILGIQLTAFQSACAIEETIDGCLAPNFSLPRLLSHVRNHITKQNIRIIFLLYE